MAAALPYSQPYAHHDRMHAQDWGLDSAPPISQSSIPWDEQVVPALRKKLELESQKLGKRISQIEASDGGWDSSDAKVRESLDRRDGRATYADESILEEELQTRTIQLRHYGLPTPSYHTGSLKGSTGADAYIRGSNGSSSTHSSTLGRSRVQSAVSRQRSMAGSVGRSADQHALNDAQSDATTRAREKARQIARARVQSSNLAPGPDHTSSPPIAPRSSQAPSIDQAQRHQRSSIDIGRDKHDGRLNDISVNEDEAPYTSTFQQQRVRTQSTPLKPTSNSKAKSNESSTSRRAAGTSEADRHGFPHQDGQEHELYGSRRGVRASTESPEAIRKHLKPPAPMTPGNKPSHNQPSGEFGPLGGVPATAKAGTTPSRTATRSGKSKVQPDAFRSLSPPRMFHRSDPEESRQATLSMPGEFGTMGSPQGRALSPSTSTNSWEDEIIPTVARKLQQQRLLAGDPRLSRVEGLIDTWDRDGLPLSISEMAMRGKQTRELAERRTPSSSRLRAQAHPDSANLGDDQEDQRSAKESRRSVQSQSLHVQMPGDDESTARQSLRQPSLETRRSKTSQSQRQQEEAETQYHPSPQTQPDMFQQSQPQHHVSLNRPAQKAQDDGAGCCKCLVM